MIRTILAFTAAAIGLYAAAFLAIALLPRCAPAAIAVVFGSQVLADGTASPRLAARLDRATLAYRQGLVPLILVSGGRGASGYDEATVMRAYLIAQGVAPGAILTDSEGIDTMSTAIHAAAIMRRRNLTSVLAVSQYFHIPRCMLALRRAGAPGIAAAYPRFAEWRDFYAIARELLALPAYAVRPAPSRTPAP